MSDETKIGDFTGRPAPPLAPRKQIIFGNEHWVRLSDYMAMLRALQNQIRELEAGPAPLAEGAPRDMEAIVGQVEIGGDTKPLVIVTLPASFVEGQKVFVSVRAEGVPEPPQTLTKLRMTAWVQHDREYVGSSHEVYFASEVERLREYAGMVLVSDVKELCEQVTTLTRERDEAVAAWKELRLWAEQNGWLDKALRSRKANDVIEAGQASGAAEGVSSTVALIEKHLEAGLYRNREDWGSSELDCAEPAIEALIAEIKKAGAGGGVPRAEVLAASDRLVIEARDGEQRMLKKLEACQRENYELRQAAGGGVSPQVTHALIIRFAARIVAEVLEVAEEPRPFGLTAQDQIQGTLREFLVRAGGLSPALKK